MFSQAIKGAIEPVFQPIVDRSGNAFAYEALMRLRDGRSACDLIQQWESDGVIHFADIEMARKVSEACSRTHRTPRVAINVSTITAERFGVAFLSELSSVADHAGGIIVEITETAPVRDMDALMRFVLECKAASHLVALDDCTPEHVYGTFEFLDLVRPDIVKVDGIYFQQCHESGSDVGLRAMIDFAKGFGAEIVVEHVVSQAHMDYAFGIGATLAQGYATGLAATFATHFGEAGSRAKMMANTLFAMHA